MTAPPDPLDALRRAPLFAELPEEGLEQLVAGARRRDLDDGEVLVREGDPAAAMYVVLEGELEVSRQVGSVEVPVNRCLPGELLGELGLLHGRERSATVRADGPAAVLEVGAERLDDLLRHPGVARRLLATATRRLEQQEVNLRTHARMATLGTLTAGLLHELNNPAAAAARSVRRAEAALEDLDTAYQGLGDAGFAARLRAAVTEAPPPPRDPLARSDAEERAARQLDALGVEDARREATALVAAGLTTDAEGRPIDLAAALEGIPRDAWAGAVTWLGAYARLAGALADAGTATDRLSEIVAAVKAFSHHGEATLQTVDVHAGLDQALTILRHKQAPGVEVRREYAADLPTVSGRPADLNGVWTNLLDNALDAVGDHGTVVIRTRAADEEVVVEVVDDGPGIAPEHRDRLFDPFFTTKPVGAGTGLGLASAFAVVTQQHRGSLTVCSDGGWTTATVRLPVRAGPPAAHHRR